MTHQHFGSCEKDSGSRHPNPQGCAGPQEPQIPPPCLGNSTPARSLPTCFGRGKGGVAQREARAATAPVDTLGGGCSPPGSCPCPPHTGSQATLPMASPATHTAQVTLSHPSATVPARLSLLLPPHGDGNADDWSCKLQDPDLCPPCLLGLDAALGGGRRARKSPPPPPSYPVTVPQLRGQSHPPMQDTDTK